MRSHSVLFISGLLSAFQGYVAAAPSPNARSVNIPGIDTNDVTDFDCPGTTQTDLTQQELQDAMDEFAYTLYTEKDVEGAFNKYVASNYVQHSPSMGDGRAKAIESLTSGFSAEGNTFEVNIRKGIEIVSGTDRYFRLRESWLAQNIQPFTSRLKSMANQPTCLTSTKHKDLASSSIGIACKISPIRLFRHIRTSSFCRPMDGCAIATSLSLKL